MPFRGPNCWRQSGHVPALGSQSWVQALQMWCAQGSRKRVRLGSECVDGSCFNWRVKSVQQTGQVRLSGSSVSGSIWGMDWMKTAKSDSKRCSNISQVLTSTCRGILSRIAKRSWYNTSSELSALMLANVCATADMLHTIRSGCWLVNWLEVKKWAGRGG